MVAVQRSIAFDSTKLHEIPAPVAPFWKAFGAFGQLIPDPPRFSQWIRTNNNVSIFLFFTGHGMRRSMVRWPIRPDRRRHVKGGKRGMVESKDSGSNFEGGDESARAMTK